MYELTSKRIQDTVYRRGEEKKLIFAFVTFCRWSQKIRYDHVSTMRVFLVAMKNTWRTLWKIMPYYLFFTPTTIIIDANLIELPWCSIFHLLFLATNKLLWQFCSLGYWMRMIVYILCKSCNNSTSKSCQPQNIQEHDKYGLKFVLKLFNFWYSYFLLLLHNLTAI